MIKRFVLDTNILLSDPQCIINGFADNIVIICGTVLQELDSKKRLEGDLGYNARECGRILDDLRKSGNLLEGVPLPSGGQLLIEPDGVKQEYLPEGMSLTVPDNRIISTCIHLMRQDPAKKVILVSNDGFMRINATACGVEVQEYLNSIVEDSGYRGYVTLKADEAAIDCIYRDKSIPDTDYPDLLENEFVFLKNELKSALCVHRKGQLQLIPEQTLFGHVKPKNALQTFAMWALSQPAEELPLVFLLGPAGTAKTYLSLAAGLDQTYVSQRRDEARYSRVLISRPTAESYQEVGFLPGTLDEKLAPLLASYYDNLENLLTAKGESKEQIQMQMQDILDDKVVEVCGLNFIRGRSINNGYIICDEAQNASRTLIRDVITRAGKGTKVVIAGDPDQIDVPTMNSRNNGLVYAAERMKGSGTTAVIHFDAEQSVRSPLAKEAIQRLKS